MPETNPYMDLMGASQSAPAAPSGSNPYVDLAGLSSSSSTAPAPATTGGSNPFMDLVNASSAQSPPTAAPSAGGSNPFMDLVNSAPAPTPTREATATQSQGNLDTGGALPQYETGASDYDANRSDSIDPVSLASNGVKDGMSMLQGLGALGSAAVGRTRENFNMLSSAIKNPSPSNLAQISRDLSHQRAMDNQLQKDVLTNMVQDYGKRYVYPVMRGDAQAIRTQLVHHPLSSYLDLLPALDIFGKGGRAAAAVAERMAPGAVPNALSKAKSYAGTVTKNLIANSPLSEAADNASAYNAMRDTLRNADVDYHAYLEKTVKDVDDAYAKVPDILKQYLIEASEGTNKTAMVMAGSSPEAMNFINKVNQLTEGITQHLKNTSLLSEEDALKARYGPSYMALLHKIGKPIKAIELADHLPRLQLFKQRLDKLGVKPGYWGLSLKKDVERFLKTEADKPVSQGLKHGERSLLKPRSSATIQEHPGTTNNARLKMRTAGVHAEDARDVAIDRLLKGARVLAIKDALDELMSNPLFTQKQKGYIAVKMERLVEGAAQHAGLNEEALTKFMGNVQKEIWLPAQTAWYEKFARLMNSVPVAGDLYNWAASTFKYLTLGPDILWPAMQFAQNGMLYGWFAVKKPQDVANALMAMYMVANPEAKAIVPNRFLLGAKAAGNISGKLPANYFLEAGEVWARRAKDLLGLLPKAVTANFHLVSNLDNYWRASAAIKFMLDEMGPAVGKGAKLVDKMFSVSLRINALEQGFADAAKSEKVLQDINDILGDYGRHRTGWSKFLEETIMFWPWLEHAWTFTKRLPFDTPLKTATLDVLTRTATPALQTMSIPSYMKRLGAVPALNSDGTQARDENGMPLIWNKPGISPFLQAPENAFQLLSIVAGKNIPEQDMSGITLNPWLRLLIWVFSSQKPGGVDYQDPRLVKYGEGYITQENAEEMTRTGKPPSSDSIIKHPRPDVIPAIGQIMFPREWLYAARLYENQIGGTPSDFTIPFVQHAPKRMKDGSLQKPLPMEEYSPAAGFGRFAPTQTRYTPEDENSIEAGNMKKSIRRYAMQQGQNSQ